MRKILTISPLLLLFYLATSALFPFTQGIEASDSRIWTSASRLPTDTETLRPSLKVLSLNVAHGRGQALNQVLVAKKNIRDNLDKISALLRHSEADIVALQEADKASLWSGLFDHAEAIAESAGYTWKAHAAHANSWLYNYGTAVLSRLPMTTMHSHHFTPSPPTLPKGFVVSEINWRHPGVPEQSLPIDVVSVHLDFLSESARHKQMNEMIEVLSQRQHPMIVLGDFNSEWQAKESPVQALAQRLNLKAYHPLVSNLSTHQDRRIDWILLSADFKFKNYAVLTDIVSDHLAVVAEVELDENALVAI